MNWGLFIWLVATLYLGVHLFLFLWYKENIKNWIISKVR